MGLGSSDLDYLTEIEAEEEHEGTRTVQRWTNLVQTLIERAILRWASPVHTLKRVRRQQRYFGHLGQRLQAYPGRLRGQLRLHLFN